MWAESGSLADSRNTATSSLEKGMGQMWKQKQHSEPYNGH
jgi:hypothetical protein